METFSVLPISDDDWKAAMGMFPFLIEGGRIPHVRMLKGEDGTYDNSKYESSLDGGKTWQECVVYWLGPNGWGPER